MAFDDSKSLHKPCFLNFSNSNRNSFPLFNKVSIYNVECDSFLDCGSEKSLISKAFFDSLSQRNREPLKPTNTVIKSLSGHQLPVVGIARLPLILPGTNMTVNLYWDFLVVDNLPFAVILGFNIMQELDSSLHFRERKLEFGTRVKNQAGYNDALACGSVVVRSDTRVDPGTFKSIDCKLITAENISIIDGDNLIISPKPEYEEFLHDYLGIVQGHKTYLLIFNDSEDTLELKHYTEIANFSRVPKEHLVAFSETSDEVKSVEDSQEATWEDEEFLSKFDLSTVPKIVFQELVQLLLANKGCFSKHAYDVCKNDLMVFQPDIPLETDFKPPKQFRIPHKMALVLEEHIQAMLKSGIIEERTSSFPSPVFLIRKHSVSKNEALNRENTRFLIDLRTVNNNMKDTAFLIPRTSDILQNLSKGTFYSEFDMRSGFFQISIDERYQKFFSFLSPLTGRSHCYTRIPQGSVFGPKAFASFMDKLFPESYRSFIFNFFDDIFIKTEPSNPNEHLFHLQRFFARLKTYNIKLSASKSQLFKESIPVLGFIVSRDKIKPQLSKLDAIEKLVRPENISELRSQLGLFNYYKCFYLNYHDLIAPLTKLLKKTQAWTWKEEQEIAWLSLVGQITRKDSEIVIHMANPEKDFELFVDSSENGVGAILCQEKDDGRMGVVCSFSRVFSKPFSKQSSIVRELYGLYETLKSSQIQYYIWGRRCNIYVDAKNLEYLRKHRDLSSKMYRVSLLMDNPLYTYTHPWD